MAFAGVFKNKIGIEKEIESFLDLVSESGLIFSQGMSCFLGNKLHSFEKQLDNIIATERNADRFRRSIEDLLYRRTLIPESRGDVLRIIETMDSLLGKLMGVMWRMKIEHPDTVNIFADDILALSEVVVKSVETVTLSVRAYFRDIGSVNDHLHKVSFWETEADKIATKIQMEVFRHKEYSLSQKMQVKDIVCQIEDISDHAEDMADSLAIFVIKRSL